MSCAPGYHAEYSYDLLGNLIEHCVIDVSTQEQDAIQAVQVAKAKMDAAAAVYQAGRTVSNSYPSPSVANLGLQRLFVLSIGLVLIVLALVQLGK